MTYTDYAFRYLRIGIYAYRKDSQFRMDIPRPFDILTRILCGKARFITADGQILDAAEGDTVYIPMGSVYRMEWQGDAPKNAALHYQLRHQEQHYPMQKLPCTIPLTEKPTDTLSTLITAYTVLQICEPLLQPISLPERDARVRPAIDYIRSHYDRQIPIEDLAKRIGLSVPRFYAVFRKCTGMTAIEYRNAVRVDIAIQQLLTTDRSVEEISDRVGFDSAIYFRRIFKRYTSLTCTEYRKKYRV